MKRIKPIQTNINSRIVHEEPVILVGPNLDKKENMFEEKQILQKYRLITYNHPDYWDHLLNDIKRYYPAVRTMKVNQIEITKRFIEHGLGVSYLPFTMIKSDKISLPTSLTYVLTKAETIEAHTFIGFLKEEIAKLQTIFISP